ncbi:MAG: hypothetical protein ACOVLE_14720 [Pirellula staleyi]|jgi:hypothetical protein
MMDARTIHATLGAWDAVGNLPVCTRQVQDATDLLTDAVTKALCSIEDVDSVTFEHGSMGSIYFDLWKDDDEWTISVRVRVSNHKAGKRACENAADIVVGDSIDEINRQLTKARQAMANEIELVLG